MDKRERIRLTQLTSKGGWAAKWGPGDLHDILKSIAPGTDPELLCGFETSDDAAVYRLNEDQAAVLTVDFFTPVVDDPYEFGRIAGANALSDVFAMGAKPLTALNILALDQSLGTEVAKDILRGGSDAAKEAGALVIGGHTIDDEEPKYGLSVFGTVHPDKIIRNQGACPGDLLYLTKPLGTGIMSAAHKVGCIDESELRPVIESMCALNAAAAHAMVGAGAHAATDITGFGLVGHLNEMLSASACAAEIRWKDIPLFNRVEELSARYCRPSRTFNLIEYAEPFVSQGDMDETTFDVRMGVLCDPQTSGGLLIALPPTSGACFEELYEEETGVRLSPIGTVLEGEPGSLRII